METSPIEKLLAKDKKQREESWIKDMQDVEYSIKESLMKELWNLTLTQNNRTQKFAYHDEDVVTFFQRGKPLDKYERDQLKRLTRLVKDTFMRCVKECLDQNKKAILENGAHNDSYLKVPDYNPRYDTFLKRLVNGKT